MSRIIKPEILDTLSPDDPRAARLRRDLRRINAFLGNHRIIAGVLRDYVPTGPRRLLEIGAGDGHFLLTVARKLGWQDVSATLLDRKKACSAETLAEFSAINWNAGAVVDDVFNWDGPEEIVVANLFLHHFDDAALVELLRRVSRKARLFIGLDPHRFYFPYPCALTTLLMGCSLMTVHDSYASIGAGFVRQEVSALWPDKSNWNLTERRAGFFSHLFIAKRI